MADFRKQLHTLTKDVHLSSADKTELRERLLNYVEHRPIRTAPRALASVSTFNIFHVSVTRFAMPAVFVAVLVLSGGVSYAAEGTVPGDALYPVKVRVNEEVRAALLVSPEDEVSWNIRRAERRLEEAAALASRGELDAENQEALTVQFEEHSNEVAEQVSELEVSNPALALEANSEFEASLTAHEEVLEQVAQIHESGRELAQELVARVAVTRSAFTGTLALVDEAEAVSDTGVASASQETMLFMAPPKPAAKRSQGSEVATEVVEPETLSVTELQQGDAGSTGAAATEIEADVRQEPADGRKEGAVRLEKLLSARIERINNFFDSYKEELSNENREYVGELIANIEMHFETAQERLQAGEEVEALGKFRALLLTILRVEVYLRSAGEFKLDNVEPPRFPSGFPEFTKPQQRPESSPQSFPTDDPETPQKVERQQEEEQQESKDPPSDGNQGSVPLDTSIDIEIDADL